MDDSYYCLIVRPLCFDWIEFATPKFAISVCFVGGAKLEATSSTLVPQINEKVKLNANLTLNSQLLEIKEAKAVIKDLDGKSETLNFPTGQNISIMWTPNKAGTYAVDIIVTGVVHEGSPIERTDFLAIQVQPNFSKGQITFNLVALIVIVLFILFLFTFAVLRGTGRLIHRGRG